MRKRERDNLATLSLPGLSAQRMRGIRRINIWKVNLPEEKLR